MALLWPDRRWPVRMVPVCIDTVQFPLPTAARCHRLGEVIGKAVRSWADTHGVELLMWLAMGGTLGAAARALHVNYHIPISNTASGLVLLEPA